MNGWARTIAILVALLGTVLGGYAQNRSDSDLDNLVSLLHRTPWRGAEIVGESPTQWDFGLTEPMKRILEIGRPAQGILLKNVDSGIKDQVIFLLGGVGDELVVEPIIGAMIKRGSLSSSEARRTNRAANLALTNITVADVIWHHGGGVVVERCRDDARECWVDWWKRNKWTFSVSSIKQSRRYSNYPNYGIYRNL